MKKLKKKKIAGPATFEAGRKGRSLFSSSYECAKVFVHDRTITTSYVNYRKDREGGRRERERERGRGRRGGRRGGGRRGGRRGGGEGGGGGRRGRAALGRGRSRAHGRLREGAMLYIYPHLLTPTMTPILYPLYTPTPPHSPLPTPSTAASKASCPP